MNHTQKILDMAKQNNGVVTAAMVVEAGLSLGSLKYLADLGKLEKTARGVYILPNALEDEFLSLQERFKCGITNKLIAKQRLNLHIKLLRQEAILAAIPF